MTDLSERIRIAERTAELFTPESLVSMTIDQLIDTLTDRWRYAPQTAAEREELYFRVQALMSVKREISRVIGDGAVAKGERERIRLMERAEDLNFRPGDDDDDA